MPAAQALHRRIPYRSFAGYCPEALAGVPVRYGKVRLRQTPTGDHGMKLLLTDRFCDRAKPRPAEPQTDYFDETVSGLALRVAVSGRKTWTLHFTSPNNGKRTRACAAGITHHTVR